MDDQAFTDRLTASDNLLWQVEADPVLRTPVLVVGLLDRSPSPERVEASVERAAAIVPRLGQRLAPPPLGLGRPRWRPAGEPSLAQHVRRVRAPGDDLDAVLAVAEPDAVAAFDPARPLWTMTIVDGLAGGRAALLLRFHHTLTDGVGGMDLADMLFDRARRPRPAGADVDGVAAGGAGPSTDHPPGGAPALLSAARLATSAARHPARVTAGAVRLGRSAARLLSPAPGTVSPVLVGRSLDRWLSVTERPMAALRRAARASGGTVNDVLLAAVAGGVYSYHRAQGEPVASVHVSMPVSVRRPGDPPGGNRFAPTHFTLPIDDPDPCARVKIAGAIVRSVRSEPAIGSTELLATGLDVLPRGVAAWLLGGVLRANDVNVVDVPGLDHRAYFAGARLDRLWGLAPTSGAALSVTLLSHERTACIGIMCDRLAVTDPPLMEQCLHDGLDEVIALGRAADRPPEPAPA